MNTKPHVEPRSLSAEELDNVVGGVGLGLRKSAGSAATGTFFLSFTFKLAA